MDASFALPRIAPSPLAQAHEQHQNPHIKGPLVLAESMYYDALADEIRLDTRVLDYERVTPAEVGLIRSGLEKPSDNGYNPKELRESTNSGVSFRIAPAIIWGGVAILGIITGGGLIFYAMYTSHAEKQNPIHQCYANGGNPVVDCRDSAGVEGTTDSGAASREGG